MRWIVLARLDTMIILKRETLLCFGSKISTSHKNCVGVDIAENERDLA